MVFCAYYRSLGILAWRVIRTVAETINVRQFKPQAGCLGSGSQAGLLCKPAFPNEH